VKIIEHFKIIQLLGYFFKNICPYFFGANALENYFCLLGIIPEIGLVGNLFFVSYFCNLAIVVKDTASGRQHGLLNPLGVQWSCSCIKIWRKYIEKKFRK